MKKMRENIIYLVHKIILEKNRGYLFEGPPHPYASGSRLAPLLAHEVKAKEVAGSYMNLRGPSTRAASEE
jgi:hypothetical protein